MIYMYIQGKEGRAKTFHTILCTAHSPHSLLSSHSSFSLHSLLTLHFPLSSHLSLSTHLPHLCHTTFHTAHLYSTKYIYSCHIEKLYKNSLSSVIIPSLHKSPLSFNPPSLYTPLFIIYYTSNLSFRKPSIGLGLGLGLHLGLGLDLGCLGLGLSLCRSSNHSGPSVLCRQFPALLGFQAGSQLCCVPGWENPCINLFAAPSEDLTQYKTRWSTPAILRVTHTAVCKQLICTVPNKQSF